MGYYNPATLALHFDRKIKWVRKKLRRQYGRLPPGKTWEWNEKEYLEKREWMERLIKKVER